MARTIKKATALQIKSAAPVNARSGITSVFLDDAGSNIHLDLTVSTHCIWQFVLPSFPTTVQESQPPLGNPNRTAVVGKPADLIGKHCTWSLRLTHPDPKKKSFPYSVVVKLLQGGNSVYEYGFDGEIDPSSGVLDAFLGETLSYRR